MTRFNKFLKEKEHDPYSEKKKYPDNTVCPQCKVIYREGRWVWNNSGIRGEREVLCPACRRIKDNFPSGLVYLKGKHIESHKEELLNLIKNQEEIEKSEHPLQRIISIEEGNNSLTVTTTYPQLARRIGEAIHRAHKGKLSLKYAKEEELLRVYWERE